MATERQKIIAEMMSSLCDRQFSGMEIAIIESAKTQEYLERKKEPLDINIKTNVGKTIINKRIAFKVNSTMKPKNKITVEHIKLYKHCIADEYTERTGKCAYGYKNIRESLGCDLATGKPIERC